jgi:hypothetical protein
MRPGARVPEVAPGRGRHRAPVDAAVFVEAAVLAQHHGRAQGRRHVGQRDPLAAPHGGIGAHALQQFAVAVEHGGVGGTEIALHVLEARKRPGRVRAGRGQHGHGEGPVNGKRKQLHRRHGVVQDGCPHSLRCTTGTSPTWQRVARRLAGATTSTQSPQQIPHPVTNFTRWLQWRNRTRTGVAFNALPARRRRARFHNHSKENAS